MLNSVEEKTLKNQSYIFLFFACLISMNVAAQSPNFDFIENKGQWDSKVKFIGSIGGNGSFFLAKNGFTVLLNNPADMARATHHPTGPLTGARTVAGTDPGIIHSHVYRVSFDGANDDIEVVPDKLQSAHNNYFIGNDPSKWASDCKIYRAVTYKNVYPGIDIRYYSDAGLLKYDIVVNPGANPDNIAMKYEGASKLSIKSNQLYVGTSVGDVKELYPYSYQFDKISGSKTDISCKFEIKNGNTVKFRVKNFARDVPLVIDPVIIFSTFTGSTSDNWGFTATPGADGSLFAGGIVANAFGTYPVTTGAIQTTHGSAAIWDMGITRFSPDGTSRMYSTYLGGSGNDFPLSLVSDAQGDLVIMGRTYSADFPKNNLVGSGGGSDLIVVKLNPAGTAILGCLRIGGSGNDAVNVEDQRGTNVLGAKRTLHFYGDDSRGEVILDGNNNIYVVSQSQSDGLSAATRFPTTPGVFQPAPAGQQDGVVLKINPGCTNVIASTYFGGSGDDGVFVMDISPTTGNLYIAGTTFSPDLKGVPSAGVKQPAINPDPANTTDGFIAELTNDLTTVVRTTYLGTPSYDAIYGLKFDKLGYPYVMGITEGTWTPVNAVYQGPAGAKQFIAKLQPDLSDYVYTTTYGTAGVHPNISPVAFLVDRCQNVYVSGWGANYVAGLDDLFPMAGTQGMETTPDAQKAVSDNRDFYFIVIKRDASKLLYASFFGQSGGFGEHVDGGTSRFDQQGVIYMAICANCEGNSVPGFPITQVYLTTPGVVAPTNGTNGNGCNLGALKISFNFAGVGAGVKAFINSVADTAGCVPLTVDFKDTVRTAVSYQWDFGDGSPSVLTTNFDISHTYTTVGSYKVMLVGIDSTSCNIRDTTYTTIRVGNNQAFLSFDYTKLAPCESLSYQFVNTSTHSPTANDFTPQSFSWDFGDGTIVTPGPNTVTHSYAAAGTYKVRLLLTDTGYCNAPDADSITLRVAPLVKAQFETPANGCVPYNAAFNNTSLAGQSFTWNFGDGTTSTAINPTHLYTSPGTYTISLVAVDTTTCNKIDSTSMTITLRSKPTAGFTYSPLTPQQNFPYTFSNTSSDDAIRFEWSYGDGDTLVTNSRADVEHQYNKTGTFNACLYATNDAGCTDTVCAPLQNIVVPRLDVPNAFTPLGNANNNIIYIRGFGIDKINWRIYNRFGNLVFSTSDRNQGWDGKYNGVVQPMDVYAYTLEVEFTDGTRETKKGDITLLR
ncbi:MAG TPA: PKD domain-containing protein [Chitinophagaceae bacterium]|jgi:gliding motility-associated-like protein